MASESPAPPAPETANPVAPALSAGLSPTLSPDLSPDLPASPSGAPAAAAEASPADSPPGPADPPPGKHYRRGLGLKQEVAAPLAHDYTGHLVRFARESGHRLRAGEVRFHLAAEFGFCYGVDRAVEYAYEAHLRFPGRRLFITGEIIHNPYVNRRLTELGIRFLDGEGDGDGDGESTPETRFAGLGPEDVVLLPAFGVSVGELEVLRRRGCVVVDTTCGSVMNVWKNVERYRREGRTAVVHGKYAHEETRATVSRAGTYLVVRDLEETRAVCRYLEAGGAGPDREPVREMSREAFLEKFRPAVSDGFDPDRDLARIGLANQTTMLGSESLEIAAVLRESMARRYGEAEMADRFRSFDTICSATQDRQDAVVELLKEDLDLVLVVGGYNSSNTAHLAHLCAREVPTYHIAEPSCLVSADEIRFRPPGRPVTAGPGGGSPETVARGWLPDGPVRIGVTSGASTPDVKVHESLVRVLGFRGLTAADCRPDSPARGVTAA